MKLKLLYLPQIRMDINTREFSLPGTYTSIPPVGMPILTSFLKMNNINVDQDDLLIKTCAKKIDLSIFVDEKKRKKFVKKGYEETLEKVGEKILKLSKCKDYDVIGFSLSEPENPSTEIIALVIAKILKEKYEPTIIIGGRISHYLKNNLLKSGYIDYCIDHHTFDAPAELNLLEFCEAFESRNFQEEKIPGLEYLDGNKMKTVPSCYKEKEISHFITPDFDGLPLDLYKYKLQCKINGSTYTGEIFALPYFFVKGCPFKCAFCCHSVESHWITEEPHNVSEKLEFLAKKYKVKYFVFLNTSINPTYKYAERIATELKNLDIKWSDSVNFALLDKALAKKLKEAGAVKLDFGLDSGSQRILNYVGKKIRLTHVEKNLKDLWEVGIWV